MGRRQTSLPSIHQSLNTSPRNLLSTEATYNPNQGQQPYYNPTAINAFTPMTMANPNPYYGMAMPQNTMMSQQQQMVLAKMAEDNKKLRFQIERLKMEKEKYNPMEIQRRFDDDLGKQYLRYINHQTVEDAGDRKAVTTDILTQLERQGEQLLKVSSEFRNLKEERLKRQAKKLERKLKYLEEDKVVYDRLHPSLKYYHENGPHRRQLIETEEEEKRRLDKLRRLRFDKNGEPLTKRWEQRKAREDAEGKRRKDAGIVEPRKAKIREKDVSMADSSRKGVSFNDGKL
mmetsp:Transcript_9422/g.10324  ORF Transcript_9422/g.10324 Transcript_9422/m.10324 type:complete len:287 (-) Transcript_9422:1232-2092(-)